MAFGTIGSQAVFMLVIGNMAGIAIGGGTLIDLIDMTAFASHIHMLTIQLVQGKVMVKFCWLPSFSRMADRTIRVKSPLMNIILGMTLKAILWSTRKDIILMTVVASDIHMLTNKIKFRLVMIDDGRLPGLRIMAGGTIGSKCSFVGIILIMTSGTILRGPLQIR